MPRAPPPLTEATRTAIKSDFDSGKRMSIISDTYNISERKISLMRKTYRDTGAIALPPVKVPVRNGRPPKIQKEQVDLLTWFLEKFPNAYIEDMCDFLGCECQLEVDETTMWRFCRKMGWKVHRKARHRNDVGLWVQRDEHGKELRKVAKPEKKPKTLGRVGTRTLMAKTREWVEEYMSQPPFDASHDFNHVLRVWTMSLGIMKAERMKHRKWRFDKTVVELTALVHDVDDHKYQDGTTIVTGNTTVAPMQPPNHNTLPPTPPHQHESPSNTDPALQTLDPSLEPPPPPQVSTLPPSPMILHHLLRLGWPSQIATTVALLCAHLSYTVETTCPVQHNAAISENPELAIVQDADRLDALGAIGIGRAFTYGGAKGRPQAHYPMPSLNNDDHSLIDQHQQRDDTDVNGATESQPAGVLDRQGALGQTIQHLDSKLLRLRHMMRTGEGKRLASVRAERLETFRGWWMQEMGLAGFGEREVGVTDEAGLEDSTLMQGEGDGDGERGGDTGMVDMEAEREGEGEEVIEKEHRGDEQDGGGRGQGGEMEGGNNVEDGALQLLEIARS